MPVLKRPASVAFAASAAKKAKGAAAQKKKAAAPMDPLEKQRAAAAAGLREADAPADVVKMIDAMLGAALKVPKDERHAYHASVVDMAETLLTGAEARMAGDVQAAEAAIAELDVTRAARDAACAAAREAVKVKEAATQEMKRKLADKARTFKAKKDALSQLQADRAARQLSIAGAVEKREELFGAQASYLKPLIESGGEAVSGDSKAKDLAEALSAALGRFQVDDSILAALPGAVLKAPEARGPFDTMVLAQLEAELTKRTSAFEVAIREGEAQCAEASAAAAAAAEELEAAREAQLSSAEEYKAALAEQRTAEAASDEAIAAESAIAPEARRQAKVRSSAEKRLATFRDGPLAALFALRDLAPPPTPPAAAAPPASEASAAAAMEVERDESVMDTATAAEAVELVKDVPVAPASVAEVAVAGA